MEPPVILNDDAAAPAQWALCWLPLCPSSPGSTTSEAMPQRPTHDEGRKTVERNATSVAPTLETCHANETCHVSSFNSQISHIFSISYFSEMGTRETCCVSARRLWRRRTVIEETPRFEVGLCFGHLSYCSGTIGKHW